MSRRSKRERRAREKELEGVNLLELAPFRVAEWIEKEGRVTLLRPAPSTSGVGGILDRILHTLSAHRIRLDPMGTFAWLQLDGTRTVGEVADLLRSEFGAEIEPAEERLARLIRMMRGEGFLGYPGYDPCSMD